MEDEKKTPLEDVIEQALDLFLYAPLGLALTARDSLPSLIEKGRKQVGQQTALAKMMGQYAMKEGEKRVRQRVESFTPPTAPAPAGSASPKPAAGPTTPTTPAEAKVEPRADDSKDITVEPAQAHTSNGSSVADQQAPSEPKSDAKPPAGPKPSADHLAIPGYDTLSASQVVQRLPGLSADELDAVRAYEESTRGRRTILTKISQLQSA